MNDDRQRLIEAREYHQKRLGINPTAGPQPLFRPVSTVTAGAMDARPTEFDGIVFRSKSEAMTAALLSEVTPNWLYEPESMRVDDWLPDFVIPVSIGHKDIALTVIEYKPADMTQTYLSEYRKRIEALAAAMRCNVNAFAWWMSWYKNELGGGYELIDGRWELFCPFKDIPLFGKGKYLFDNKIEKVKKIRFDLV